MLHPGGRVRPPGHGGIRAANGPRRITDPRARRHPTRHSHRQRSSILGRVRRRERPIRLTRHHRHRERFRESIRPTRGVHAAAHRPGRTVADRVQDQGDDGDGMQPGVDHRRHGMRAQGRHTGGHRVRAAQAGAGYRARDDGVGVGARAARDAEPGGRGDQGQVSGCQPPGPAESRGGERRRARAGARPRLTPGQRRLM